MDTGLRASTFTHIDQITFDATQCMIPPITVQAGTGERDWWLRQPQHARLHDVWQRYAVCQQQSRWVISMATHAMKQLPENLHGRHSGDM